MNKTYLLIVVLLFATQVFGDTFAFGTTKEFCKLKFEGEMAPKGEPFNATDVINEGLPRRRLIGEFVTSTVAYIWYEHGGRGYHQHLVRFNVINPKEILENYTFIETKHKDIFSLIKNKHLLADSDHGEL